MKPGDITYEIVRSGTGPDTIIVRSGGRDIPLHSRVDPEREAESYRDRFDPDRFDVLIVLGVGLGYHLLPLKKHIDDFSRIILIDILEGINDAIARNPLTSFLLESPRVALAAGKEPEAVGALVSDAIDMEAVRGISVLEHPASLRMFPDYYGQVKKSIEKLIHRKAGDMATRKAFGPLYLRNILKNIPLMGNASPVKDLCGLLKNYPAVIAASGPSLDGDVEQLKRFQDRFFIVAVDSALPSLRSRGIFPDIVVSIDPQPYVSEHFITHGPDRALLVSSISSHPSVMRKFGGFLSLNSHPLSQMIAGLCGDFIGSIDSATGTVAGDAVSLCASAGCSAAGITGLDFSFSGFSIYARGTAYQNRYAVYFQDRFSTVEGFNCRYILKSSGGFREGGRFTRKSFMQYRHATEDLIQTGRTMNICALNDRGAPLAGVPVRGVDEFVERYCGSEIDKNGIIGHARASAGTIDAAKVKTALADVLHGRQLDELLFASLGGRRDSHVQARLRDNMARLFA